MSGDALAREVAAALVRAGLVLATAESCTGGGIAARLTALAGSSAWFDRGFVSYSNAAKQQMLGVPAALIGAHGAVSEAVVLAMAAGALANSAATVSAAVSGVAGPGGGTARKPVGTVWMACQGGGGRVARQARFRGDRDAVRRQASDWLLRGLLAFLAPGSPGEPPPPA